VVVVDEEGSACIRVQLFYFVPLLLFVVLLLFCARVKEVNTDRMVP